MADKESSAVGISKQTRDTNSDKKSGIRNNHHQWTEITHNFPELMLAGRIRSGPGVNLSSERAKWLSLKNQVTLANSTPTNCGSLQLFFES